MGERGFNAFRVLQWVAPGAAMDVDEPWEVGGGFGGWAGKPDVEGLQAAAVLGVRDGRDMSGVGG